MYTKPTTPAHPTSFATGWLIVLAVILVSIPLAMTFDALPHAITFAIAGVCSLAIIMGAVRWTAS